MTNSQPSPLALEPTPRQTEILEQALQLVQAHGLANLTLKKVAERVGFRQTGVEPAAHRLGDGTFVDQVRYQVQAGELAPTVP